MNLLGCGVSLVLACLVSLLTAAAPQTRQPFKTRPVNASVPTGGHGGTPFSEVPGTSPDKDGPVILGIDSVTFTYGRQLESIQVTYRLSNGSHYIAPRHGANTMPSYTLSFSPDEYMEKIEGFSSGYIVEEINVGIVNRDKKEHALYGPFGGKGDGPLESFSMEGYVAGFYGRSGDCVDSIGVYTLAPLKQSQFFGGIDGLDFDDNPDLIFHTPAVKVITVSVSEGYGENGISVRLEYLLLRGDRWAGEWRGKREGKLSVIAIADTEVLVGIEGTYSNTTLGGLTFVVSEDGSRVKHGPFGHPAPKPFSVYGYVMGLAGIAGDYLAGMRVYYI